MKESRCIVCQQTSKLKFKYKNYRILQCPHCSMIFVDPKSIDQNYKKQYENNISSPMNYYKKTESYDIKSFEERLLYLKKYFKKPKSLLEIGSNTGTFLKTAFSKGWEVSSPEITVPLATIF
ncbi:MAG: hypothetical protein ABIJ83_03505 [Patescibacteria group bacterium]